jgi:hypothetical protein
MHVAYTFFFQTVTAKNFEVCELCHINIDKTLIDMRTMAQYLPVVFGLVMTSYLLFTHFPVYVHEYMLLLIVKLRAAGTPAITTRGCLEDGFERIADFLIGMTQIAGNILIEHWKVQEQLPRGLENNKDNIELANQVEAFLSEFAVTFFDV